MFVTVDGRPAGIIGVDDPIKDTTAEAIRAYTRGTEDRDAPATPRDADEVARQACH